MGARQVGKTWLMGDFGRKNFRKVHSFDFVAMPDMATVFAATKNPDEILPKLELISGSKIDRRYDVLVLDEIQDCGDALNSLKYFYKETTEDENRVKIARLFRPHHNLISPPLFAVIIF